MSHRQARHERGRCLHRHLLPENRAKGDLETTPAAWHAGPRVTRNQLGKSRVKSKCAVDYLTVCTQVEYRANALNHPLKPSFVVYPDTERNGIGVCAELRNKMPLRVDLTLVIDYSEAARITRLSDLFDTGYSAIGQKTQQCCPVEGRPVT